MKRFLTVLLILGACLLPLAASAAGAADLRGYKKSEPKATQYQYVNLGEYPYEKDGTTQPVLWRILDVSDGRALLLTEYVIDTSQVIFNDDPDNIKGKTHNYRWIDTYEESDLYVYLNTEFIEKLFGDDPVRQAFLDEPGGGKLFILNEEQMTTPEYGFGKAPLGEHPERQAVGTPWAHATRGLYKDGGNGKTTYWVSTLKNGAQDYKMKIVGYNGHISVGALTRVNIGLRLAVRLDLAKISGVSGSGTKKSPFVLTAKAPETTETPAASPAAEETAKPTRKPAAKKTAEPTAAPTQAPEKADGGALISFIGDCSIGDSFNAIKTPASYHSVVDREGYEWPFSQVNHYLKADDLTVANLEVVITTKVNRKSIMYPLRADPDHVNILLSAGIEMVNTANNHCMDYHEAGYKDSLQYLEEAGIQHFGSISYNKKSGGFDNLAVREVNGITFGFMGFSYPHDYDIKAAVQRAKKLKEEQGCDVVVASMHWGRETYMTPNSDQVKWAKQLIDGGVDLVYGHHPHVLQTMCFYKGKPILFSVGNFTFGTMSSVDPRTGIFQTTYEKIGGQAVLRKLQVIPCRTSGSNDYRPFEVTEEGDRQAVYRALVAKKAYSKCDNPPDSFLTTGIVLFDENGQMLH